jgi:hypothetical protein
MMVHPLRVAIGMCAVNGITSIVVVVSVAASWAGERRAGKSAALSMLIAAGALDPTVTPPEDRQELGERHGPSWGS